MILSRHLHHLLSNGIGDVFTNAKALRKIFRLKKTREAKAGHCVVSMESFFFYI